MDRRNFMMSLIGGLAAASVGSVAMAQAAPALRTPVPIEPALAETPVSAALDETDAEFAQYRRRYRHHRRHRMMHRRRPRRMRRMMPDRRARPNTQR